MATKEVLPIKISEILSIIPDVLQYFVSGYVFLFFYKTICSKKIDSTMQLIGSCVISFSWVALLRAIDELYQGGNLFGNMWIVTAFSIILSVITSLAFSKIFISKGFHRLSVGLFGKTPHDSIWRNIIDSESGVNIKAHFHNCQSSIVNHQLKMCKAHF